MPAFPLSVLLIEDDDGYATLVGAQLRDNRYFVLAGRARSLAEATAIGDADRFDVVLLDLGLPDSSGLDTLVDLRKALPHAPVVVLTARDDDELAVAALHRGAQDYLVKSDTDALLLTRALRYAHERAGLRRELQEREARFRALLDYSSEGVSLLDAQFRSFYDTRAIEAISGYTSEELRGRTLDELVHPDDRPDIQRQFARCLERPDEPLAFSYRFRHRDGSWRHGEGVAVNRLGDPAVRAVVVNYRDVTERKEAEAALRRSEEQLRQAQKMEAVGRLAGGVAHDFNNVLTAIFGYADLLLDQFEAGDPRRADVEEIRRSADRAASLTRQLLAFSRKQVTQPRVVNLNEVVHNLRRLLARLVGEDVELEVQGEADLWPVRMDPGQIEQVLMNLSANARDAMPEGGRLAISTENRIVGEEDLRLRPGLQPGPHVLLTVRDWGHGMSETVRAHVFEPFFTTKEQGKGTGLGLPMVYGIVKQSGGGTYVESEEERGTRVLIYLPRADVPS